MFDKEQEKKIKAMLMAYDRAESDTLLKSAPEEFEFSEEFENTIVKIRRKEITMTVNVKRALIIAAAIVLAIAVISVVAVAGSKYVITIKNDRSNDFEISMGNIDLTQMDFLALSIPEDYENVVVWERMGVWGKHTDTQRNFVVHVEEVPSDTVIEIKDGVECKTKRLDGAKIYYETYLETVEFRDRTELWGWINYYYLNDICYIEVAHSILIPPECEDAEAYLEDEMIPHKQVFKIIKETYDQIKEVNGIK